MRYIYIVLIKAHTGLGSVARKFTLYPYTHIAVCPIPRQDGIPQEASTMTE